MGETVRVKQGEPAEFIQNEEAVLPAARLDLPELEPQLKEKPAILGAFGGLPGPTATLGDLLSLVASHPQVDSDGQLRYLISGGFAVELITQLERDHADLDIVTMSREARIPNWQGVKLDQTEPYEYYGNLALKSTFLDETKVETVQIETPAQPEGVPILVVHPGVLIVQKCSNFYGRDIRQKDMDDAVALLQLADQNDLFEEWAPIVHEAIQALDPKEIMNTIRKLAEVADNTDLKTKILQQWIETSCNARLNGQQKR